MKSTAQEGIKNLIGKVIRFTDEVEKEEIDFDSGMLARIKSISPCHPSNSTWKVYDFVMDFSEFEEYNKGLMKANYFNSNGVPCKTWTQQPRYEEDLKNGCQIYLQFEDDSPKKQGELIELPFEIAPNQLVPPTVDEALDALERTIAALKDCKCANISEVLTEANHILSRAGRK